MKYRVKHDGITKTYAALHHTASHLLDVAKTKREGSLLNIQAAAVFYAFTFEAYLNHVGADDIEIWEEIERISYSKKLRILAKHLKLTPDWSKPPFQTIEELFQLRDILAHGRTRTIDVEYETDDEPQPMSNWRIHEWEKLTPEKVDNYAKCVREAIGMINGARQHPDEDLWNQGIRGRMVRLIEKEGNIKRLKSACHPASKK